MGRGRGGAAAGRSSGFDGGGGVGTKSLVRGDKSLRPSEKTVPRPRLWPDFDDVRYVVCIFLYSLNEVHCKSSSPAVRYMYMNFMCVLNRV